jgi:hypothetical protein
VAQLQSQGAGVNSSVQKADQNLIADNISLQIGISSAISTFKNYYYRHNEFLISTAAAVSCSFQFTEPSLANTGRFCR